MKIFVKLSIATILVALCGLGIWTGYNHIENLKAKELRKAYENKLIVAQKDCQQAASKHKNHLCLKSTNGCEITDICGDLVGLVCPRGLPRYMIIKLSTNEVVSQNDQKHPNYKDLVPNEWSCITPENMPLSKSEQQKYPQYKNRAVSCGDILGVNNGVALDGAYNFIDKETGKFIEYCSYWKSLKTRSRCQPPLKWYCGNPSNYR